jgi:hypothetical protein
LSFRQLKEFVLTCPRPKIRPDFSSTLRLEIQIQVDHRSSLAGLDLIRPKEMNQHSITARHILSHLLGSEANGV